VGPSPAAAVAARSTASFRTEHRQGRRILRPPASQFARFTRTYQLHEIRLFLVRTSLRVMDHPYLFSYPYLDNLVGGWFHQDFDIEGGTLEEIIQSYKKSSPADDVLGTKADIQRFIRQAGADHLTEKFVEIFQPDVDPTAWGMSTRDWLLRIYDLL
jgi:hypothetical protein